MKGLSGRVFNFCWILLLGTLTAKRVDVLNTITHSGWNKLTITVWIFRIQWKFRNCNDFVANYQENILRSCSAVL